jgi:hypothetical protein
MQLRYAVPISIATGDAYALTSKQFRIGKFLMKLRIM